MRVHQIIRRPGLEQAWTSAGKRSILEFLPALVAQCCTSSETPVVDDVGALSGASFQDWVLDRLLAEKWSDRVSSTIVTTMSTTLSTNLSTILSTIVSRLISSDEENCRAARVEGGLGYYCAHCATSHHFGPHTAHIPSITSDIHIPYIPLCYDSS